MLYYLYCFLMFLQLFVSFQVVWLVLIAFFLADAFQKTGLGDRIALNVIRAVGGTTLGLAYGVNFAELLVAAAMPCSAARVRHSDLQKERMKRVTVNHVESLVNIDIRLHKMT